MQPLINSKGKVRSHPPSYFSAVNSVPPSGRYIVPTNPNNHKRLASLCTCSKTLQVHCCVLRHAEAQYTTIQSCKRLQLLVWPSALWVEASAALTRHCIHNTVKKKISALETQLKCRNSRCQTGRCHRWQTAAGRKSFITSSPSPLTSLPSPESWCHSSLTTPARKQNLNFEFWGGKKKKKSCCSRARRATWRIDKNDLSFPCSPEWNIIKTNVCFWLLPTVGKLWDAADSFRQKVWWTERESMHHLLRPALNEKALLQMN